MTTSAPHAPSPADREIVNERLIQAPRERVFQAFTNPYVLARWWGPKGFTNTFEECDVRPGGSWRFTMHGPQGMDLRNHNVFLEVQAPERIVIQHLQPVHDFTLTVTLAEQGKATRLTWRMRFATAEEHERMKDFIHGANEQNLDRLEAQLI